MDKPPFEDCYPEIEGLIQSHKWRQRLRGMELEDLEQEMRRLAYKAYKRWDPARGPLKVLWWRYVVNYRTTYLQYLDRPKRQGVQLCSLEMFHNDPHAAEEIPVNGVSCPTEDLELRRMWALYELEYPVTEIMRILDLTPIQYYHRRVLLQRVLNGEDIPVSSTECEWCGGPIVGRNRTARFCSKEHRKIAYNHNLRLQRLSASSTADTSASFSAF